MVVQLQDRRREMPGADEGDVKLALDALAAVQADYTRFANYEVGHQPLSLTSHSMLQLWQKRPALVAWDHVDNVVPSVLRQLSDGVSIARVEVDDTDDQGRKSETAQELEANTMTWWRDRLVNLELESAMYNALVFGESHLLAWPGDDGELDVYYHDPRNVRLFYEENKPRVKRMAAHWYDGSDGTRRGRRLDLYYPDRIVKLFREHQGTYAINVLSNRVEGQYETLSVERNPYRIVPVFTLKAHHPVGRSLVEGLIPAQNRINKYVVGKTLTVDYGVNPLLFIMTKRDIKNGDIKGGPGAANPLDPGDSVEKIDPQDPSIFDRLKEAEIESIRRNEGLPRSFTQATGADLSGESQRVAEAPLVKRRQDIINNYSPEIAALLAFRWQVLGVNAPYTHAVFDDPGSNMQSLAIAEFTALVNGGVPRDTAVRRAFDWDDSDIETMREDEAAGGPDVGDLARLVNSGELVR